jgi:hypothetical protein
MQALLAIEIRSSFLKKCGNTFSTVRAISQHFLQWRFNVESACPGATRRMPHGRFGCGDR